MWQIARRRRRWFKPAQQPAVQIKPRHATGAILDGIQRVVRAGFQIVWQLQRQRLPARIQNLQKLSVIAENLDAIVEGVRRVNLAVAPDQTGRTLELAGLGPKPAEREQKLSVRREFLHAVIGAVFRDVKILLRVLGHSNRVNEFARALAFLSKRFERLSIGCENHHAMIMGVTHHDAAIAKNADTLRVSIPVVGHSPLVRDGPVRRIDQHAAVGIQRDYFAAVAGRQAARRRLQRSIGRHRPQVGISLTEMTGPVADGRQPTTCRQSNRPNSAFKRTRAPRPR